MIGQNIKVFLDQELIHVVVDFDTDAPSSGCVGVGTWETSAEFGAVLVRDMRRRTLYDMSNANLEKNSNSIEISSWNISGDAVVSKGDAVNGDCCLRFNKEGSLEQGNFVFRTGEIYDYSFWSKGIGGVDLHYNYDSNGVDVETFRIESDEWIKLSGNFKASEDCKKASIYLKIIPDKDARLDVDQISIMPRYLKNENDDLRPDLFQAISKIRPALIRWSGGCYASAYRWKSGIGSQDSRVSYPLELWDDIDPNSFGTDEFVSLCRKVGAELLIVIDAGTKKWTDAVGSEEVRSNDRMQEACDWLEYCNGSSDTRWGAVRAQNGHHEPYNVRYWEIDNEVDPTSTSSAEYVEIINTLVPRLKKIDPNIKTVV